MSRPEICRAQKECIMAVLSDNPPLLTAPPGPLPTTPFDVVKSLGEKLAAALAHTSPSDVLESRRRMEHVLGKKLEPRFAHQLLSHLFVPSSEARELRAAFVNLLSMTESPPAALPVTRGPSAMSSSDNEAKFLASEEAICVQDLARCGECLASSATKREGKSVTSDEAARLQWAACAQCRCGTDLWYRS
jgi:hypothetical protein